MRYPVLAAMFVVSLAGGASALDLNVDLGVGSHGDKEGSTDSWAVQICRPATEARQVKIEVGEPGSKDRETLVWDRSQTRSEGAVQELAVPRKFRDLGKVFVKGTAEPKNDDVLMAVVYGGKAKKVFSFSKSEKHDVSINDPDTTFDCPSS